MVDGELGAIVGEGIESVDIIETLLILTMAALNFAVVPGCVGAD